MPCGYMPLLKRRVAWQVDGFHTIEQRRRNGVETISSCNEEDLAQVNWNINVVVSKSMILLRVKNFKHSC